MPIYEYACGACGHAFEEWQKMSDPPVKTCPKCKKKKVEKLISHTAFQLKGGGWYKDLYSSSKSASGSGDKSGEKTGSGDKSGDTTGSGDKSGSGDSSSSSKDSSSTTGSASAAGGAKPAKSESTKDTAKKDTAKKSKARAA